MSSGRSIWLPTAVALLAMGMPSARASDPTETWTDPKGDAVIRRTDANGNGALGAGSTLPDMIRVDFIAWQSSTAAADPFNGSPCNPEDAHLFRIDVSFAGLVNPPGRLGDGVAIEYRPFEFGPSPLYGFLEIDVDHDRNTGGELGTAARTRYLANVARFGRLPSHSNADRAAIWGTDLDRGFDEVPQYRRSGADFLLSFCGCSDVTILNEGGNGNHIFEPGETWTVRGAFFQRSGGYVDSSFAFGGTSGVPGMYDPQVKIRFSHSQSANRTVVSLVYALDMTGAGQLAGAPPEPVNYNAGDQTSVLEGLQDVIDAAGFLNLPEPVRTLAQRWTGRSAWDFLDPTEWNMTALFGTAFATIQDSPFVWTDTGCDETPGDMNHDGYGNSTDALIVRDQIVQLDGGPQDGDVLAGVVGENWSVRIIGYGANFCLYDITGDGVINYTDVRFLCPADFDMDGRLTVNDYITFGSGFAGGNPQADIDRSGNLDINDFVAFGASFSGGCP